MEKFLFTDGTGGIKEAHSRQELEDLADASLNKQGIQVWVYNHQEWLNWTIFINRFPGNKRRPVTKATKAGIPETEPTIVPAKRPRRGLKLLGYGLVATAIFLVFNFTRLNWEEAPDITVRATRPGNVPYINVDSLVSSIEQSRGQRIDRNTKSNLRLRNTWPEHILLSATAKRSMNGNSTKYNNLVVTIDNTTGHPIEEATVLITILKDDQVSFSDTLHFSDITHNGEVMRAIPGVMKGDSLAVTFAEIKAKSFNFCYSDKTENNSGNYNDRWFCREK